jgi:hypothetical protein
MHASLKAVPYLIWKNPNAEKHPSSMLRTAAKSAKESAYSNSGKQPTTDRIGT